MTPHDHIESVLVERTEKLIREIEAHRAKKPPAEPKSAAKATPKAQAGKPANQRAA
jgi:hypothetical protein